MAEINKMIVPAAIAGAAAAVFTGIISLGANLIPFIGLLNLACCLWLTGGGALAAYLLKKKVGKIELKDGAIVGALTGVFFAAIETVFTGILMLSGLGANLAALRELMGDAATGTTAAIGVLAIVFSFVMFLLVGTIFCTIGGVLGAKLLGK